MARMPRIYVEGALYYITSRGVHKGTLFKDERDYRQYLELLNNYKAQYGFKLFAFALLPNHLHLLIELKEGTSISAIMHDVNSMYTKNFNTQYGRKGHLFQERFRAVLVEKEPYLSRMTRYIHLNPERLGLITELINYPYSSYPIYVPTHSPYPKAGTPQYTSGGYPELPIINMQDEIQEVLGYLKGKPYQEFVTGVSSEEMEALNKGLRRGGCFGSKEFVEKIKSQVTNHRSQVTSHRLHALRRYPDVVGRTLGIPRKIVFASTIFLLCFLGAYFLKINLDVEKYVNKQIGLKKVEGSEHFSLTEDKLEPGELEGTEWELELTLISTNGSQHKFQTDRIRFKNGKVISSNLVSSGYRASNYTVTVKRDGTIAWETIQTNKKQDTAYWYGEWEGKTMKGILTLRSTKGNPQNFSFVSQQCKRKG